MEDSPSVTSQENVMINEAVWTNSDNCDEGEYVSIVKMSRLLRAIFGSILSDVKEEYSPSVTSQEIVMMINEDVWTHCDDCDADN